MAMRLKVDQKNFDLSSAAVVKNNQPKELSEAKQQLPCAIAYCAGASGYLVSIART